MAAVIVLMMGIMLMVFSTMLNGYVLSVLWKWFIVPTFDLSPLTVPQAIGLAMIVSFLTFHAHGQGKSKDDDATTILIKGFLMVLLKTATFLGIGWIVVQFM